MSEKAEEIKRPQSKDFFSNVIEMNDAFLNEPKLYQFIQALDNYIDHLEENQFPSPQEVTRESELLFFAQYLNECFIVTGAMTYPQIKSAIQAWEETMRSKLTNK